MRSIKTFFTTLLILLSSGVFSNAWSKDCPELAEAAGNGKIEKVNKLIDDGCDVESFHKSGLTALMYGVLIGHTPIIKLLIANGADVNARPTNGETVLMRSARTAQSVRTDLVKLLIGHGADVNAKTKDGETALSIAKEKGHDEIIKLLKDAGAKE
ncbi:ankyrin repeat domain-containing protein [Thermodesulfobacteriota bacterium]